jgi:hypothetical protein
MTEGNMDHDRSHELEERENEYLAGERSLKCAENEIADLKEQVKSLKSKINRMYLLAEMLDEEALNGAWTDTKQSKMRSAALIRQRLEG